MTSESTSRRATSVTSSTARLKTSSFAFDGRVVPLNFRTNCSAEARTSSSEAGGSKFASVFMLRHMKRTSVQLRELSCYSWVLDLFAETGAGAGAHQHQPELQQIALAPRINNSA